MPFKAILAVFVLLLSQAVAQPIAEPIAQPNQGTATSPQPVDLNIRVTWTGNETASLKLLRVQVLAGAAESNLTEAFTDDQGEIPTFKVFPGNYRLRITGANILETITPSFRVSPFESNHIEFVRVKYKPAGDLDTPTSTQGKISAAELNIPDKARDEFEKGNLALEKDQTAEAKRRLEHAVSIYPRYAAAWNTLGVISMKAGDVANGSDFFDKALAADPQFAAAYVNRGKILFSKADFKSAEESLQKAVTISPLDPEATTLLATAQLQNGELAQAVETARKVHQMPHSGFGGAHLVAASALEKLKQPAEALAEYRLYVAETPTGTNVARARSRIEQLSQQIH